MQQFQLPWPHHTPRRAAESMAGWLAQARAEGTDPCVSITVGVVLACLCNASRALDWSTPPSKPWQLLVKKHGNSLHRCSSKGGAPAYFPDTGF